MAWNLSFIKIEIYKNHIWRDISRHMIFQTIIFFFQNFIYYLRDNWSTNNLYKNQILWTVLTEDIRNGHSPKLTSTVQNRTQSVCTVLILGYFAFIAPETIKYTKDWWRSSEYRVQSVCGQYGRILNAFTDCSHFARQNTRVKRRDS